MILALPVCLRQNRVATRNNAPFLKSRQIQSSVCPFDWKDIPIFKFEDMLRFSEIMRSNRALKYNAKVMDISTQYGCQMTNDSVHRGSRTKQEISALAFRCLGNCKTTGADLF
jgi:hypothetical protein